MQSASKAFIPPTFRLCLLSFCSAFQVHVKSASFSLSSCGKKKKKSKHNKTQRKKMDALATNDSFILSGGHNVLSLQPLSYIAQRFFDGISSPSFPPKLAPFFS